MSRIAVREAARNAAIAAVVQGTFGVLKARGKRVRRVPVQVEDRTPTRHQRTSSGPPRAYQAVLDRARLGA